MINYGEILLNTKLLNKNQKFGSYILKWQIISSCIFNYFSIYSQPSTKRFLLSKFYSILEPNYSKLLLKLFLPISNLSKLIHVSSFERIWERICPASNNVNPRVFVCVTSILARAYSRFAFVWTTATCTRFPVLFWHCLCAHAFHHIPVMNVYTFTYIQCVLQFSGLLNNFLVPEIKYITILKIISSFLV